MLLEDYTINKFVSLIHQVDLGTTSPNIVISLASFPNRGTFKKQRGFYNSN